MRSGPILLKHNLASHLGHSPVVIKKNLVKYLILIVLCHHSPSLPSWIIQNHQWPLASPHDTSPNHHPKQWLLKCRDDTTLIKFLTRCPGNPNRASIIANIDIAFIWPDDPILILFSPALVFSCPLLSALLVVLCKIHNLTSSPLMHPHVVKNPPNSSGQNLRCDQFPN